MANSIPLVVALIIVLIVGFGMGLVAGPFLMPQRTVTDSIWDNIVATGKIKIGTDPTWPPYESIDSNGKMVGFEVDLANAVAEKLGLAAEWQSVSFADIMGKVKDKSLDLGVSGFSVTAERLSQVLFTIPHSEVRRQVLMNSAKKEALHITTLNSLSDLKTLGIKVGVQAGTTQIDELATVGVNYKSFGDFGLAMADMMSDSPTVEAVYAETPIYDLTAEYSALGKTIAVVYDAPYFPHAFMTNINAYTLTAKINGALVDIIQSGQMDALKAKWNLTVTQ